MATHDIKIGKMNRRGIATVTVDGRDVGAFIRHKSRRTGHTIGYRFDVTIGGRRLMRSIDVDDQGGDWAEARRDLVDQLHKDVRTASSDAEHGTRTCTGCGREAHFPFSCDTFAQLVAFRGEPAAREQLADLLKRRESTDW